MKTFITGTYNTTLNSAPQKGAFYANTNQAPSWCTGALTSDLGLVLLRRITNAP